MNNSIDGWMSDEELAWLANAASEHSVIVEVGCFIGRTTKVLANNTNGILFAIDPWDDNWIEGVELVDPPAYEIAKKYYPDVAKTFYENLRGEIESFKVIMLQGTVHKLRREVDMVFIDGDHRYPAVYEDIVWAKQHVRRGGLIAGHDYSEKLWPDVREAVDTHFDSVENPVGSIWFKQI